MLSGPAHSRTQVGALLRQVGADVEAGNEDPHGFTREDGESFVTAHYGNVAVVARAVEPIGWRLRSHWASSGPWRKVGSLAVEDPMAELNRLKSQLRAAGIRLGASK